MTLAPPGGGGGVVKIISGEIEVIFVVASIIKSKRHCHDNSTHRWSSFPTSSGKNNNGVENSELWKSIINSWMNAFLGENRLKITLLLSNPYRIPEFTTNSLFREITINSLGLSRIYYGFEFFFANRLWILYLFREFTMN